MRVFLDTNIFLYAAGQEHEHQATCRDLLRRCADGELDATTNVEVIQEILYVLSRRGRRHEGLLLAGHILTLFPEMLPVVREDLAYASKLLEGNQNLSTRDAVHAATMKRNNISVIITTDRHFDSVPGIKRLAPSEAS